MGFSAVRLCAVCATSAMMMLACRPPAPKIDPSSLEAAAKEPGLTLPQFTSFFDSAEAEVVVVVTRDQVLLAGDRFPVAKIPPDARLGLLAGEKFDGARDEFLVTPLAHAIVGAPRPPPRNEDQEGPTATGIPRAPPVVVAADEKTTYRVLAEVLSTAAKAKNDEVGLAARGKRGVMVLPLAYLRAPQGFENLVSPSSGGWSPRVYDPVLVIVIAHDGFVVSVGGRAIATGCQAMGRGTTVPNEAGGARAYASLADCIGRISKASPDSTSFAWIGAEPDVDVGTVVATRDAIFQDRTGKVLVQDIGLVKPVDAAGSK
jgi:hypothetical protein